MNATSDLSVRFDHLKSSSTVEIVHVRKNVIGLALGGEFIMVYNDIFHQEVMKTQ